MRQAGGGEEVSRFAAPPPQVRGHRVTLPGGSSSSCWPAVPPSKYSWVVTSEFPQLPPPPRSPPPSCWAVAAQDRLAWRRRRRRRGMPGGGGRPWPRGAAVSAAWRMGSWPR